MDVGTIGDPDGGFITLDSGLASNGDLVTIVSNIPEDRTVDYQNSGDFLPDTVNTDFDRTVSLVKQQEDRSNRSVAFQESQQNVSGVGLPAPQTGAYLTWGIGNNIVNSGAPGTVIPGTNVANVAAMVADLTLQVGDYVWTGGYYSTRDRDWETHP